MDLSCSTIEVHNPVKGVTQLVLNRPERLNAISLEMRHDLLRICDALEDDTSCHVVVLTGAGDRAFSAGADVHELKAKAGQSPLESMAGTNLTLRVVDRVQQLPQITVAAVNGLSVGGAVGLVLACDLRIASADAWFSVPEVAHRIAPFTWSMSARLAAEVGVTRSNDLIFTGRRLLASEALSWGLINEVVPHSKLGDRVAQLSLTLSELDPVVARLAKQRSLAIRTAMVPEHARYADPYLVALIKQNPRDNGSVAPVDQVSTQ